MRLVTTISFSVLFNGECLYSLTPSHGISQGDPISPYLLLAAKGLSCLLKSRNESSVLSGIKVALSALVVSHLLFVDDSKLLFRMNRENAQEVHAALETYFPASVQQLNVDKSSIHFVKGYQQRVRWERSILRELVS